MKERLDFRSLDEVYDWEAEGEERFTFSGMAYVWILCLVDRHGKGADGKEEVKTLILPCRLYLTFRNIVIPDIYGNYKEYEVRGWRPMIKPLC